MSRLNPKNGKVMQTYDVDVTEKKETETEFAKRQYLRSKKAKMRLDRLKPEKVDMLVEKLSEIAGRKNWEKKIEIIQQMCPLCENLPKWDREPFIPGTCNVCLMELLHKLEKEEWLEPPRSLVK